MIQGGDNCNSNYCDRPHEVQEPIIILSVTTFLLYVCRLEAGKKTYSLSRSCRS